MGSNKNEKRKPKSAVYRSFWASVVYFHLRLISTKNHKGEMTRNRVVRKGTWVRIPPSPPRRSKVRFAPTSFYACGKKDVIRPLPCSSFPTTTRCAGLAVGGPPCGRPFSRLRNIDFSCPGQQSLGNTCFPRIFLFLLQTSEQRAKRQKSQIGRAHV